METDRCSNKKHARAGYAHSKIYHGTKLIAIEVDTDGSSCKKKNNAENVEVDPTTW